MPAHDAKVTVRATVEEYLGRYVGRDWDGLRTFVVPDEHYLIDELAEGLPEDFRVLGAGVRAIVLRAWDRAEALQELEFRGDGERVRISGWVDLERGGDGAWRVRPSTMRKEGG